MINMKPGIHPQYYPSATIKCGCGNTITVGSTIENMTVEICGACHPYYTGQHRFVDTAGRIDKFKARLEKAKTPKK